MTQCIAALCGVAAVAQTTGGKPSAPPASSASGPTAPAPRVTFTYRITDEPESLDWNLAHSSQETWVMTNLMEGLLTFDKQFKIAPALAERWTISPDGKTYTFTLRPHVKWSDGVPLKAQDFVYGWKRLLSPLTGAFYNYLLHDIEGAEEFGTGKTSDFSTVGVKALDDRTLQVKLVRPIAHWIYVPTMWMTFPLRQDIVEKYGNSWCTPGRMVTVGPYTLESYEIGRKLVMRANPNYYGKRGNVEEVVGLVVKDDATALNLWETNRLDLIPDISSADLGRFAGRPELKTYPQIKTVYLGFVVSRFPAIYPGLRRAIAMAIDRKRVAQMLGGGKKPASSFVPPPLLAHHPIFGLKYDPAAAKAELKRSGLDLTKPIKLELIHMNWDKPQAIALYIQAELKRVLGIQVELKGYDHPTFHALLDTHQFPMYVGQWAGDFPDPDNFMTLFAFGARKNRTTWRNKEFDTWVNEARGLRDERKRLDLYTRAQRMLIENEAVIVPLYYDPNQVLLHTWVEGAELNPLQYLFMKHVNVRKH